MSLSCYSTQSAIELLMCLLMLFVICLVFLRSHLNSKRERPIGYGISTKIIQFTFIALIVPAIIILGIERILHTEAISTIIGGLIGYVLSGVSDGDADKKKDKDETPH